MDLFDVCWEINALLTNGNDQAARNMLIKLLSDMNRLKAPYPPVLNELIRSTGLFPYMQLETASWDQKFVHQAFAVDIGRRMATLHREQSSVLAKLLDGRSIAVSAPTSFGKSFIIDAYIAAKKPRNVVLIVPTIALMDETRRRLYKKFSADYRIITGPEANLGQKNILVFPQERAFGYIDRILSIDLLVVDEFYKASTEHDRDRAPSLLKAVLKLPRSAKQRYYLAPNIKKLGENVFTKGMEFVEVLDFNTVFLEKHDLYQDIKGDEALKSQKLIEILEPRTEKSLVYAGTYSEISKLTKILTGHFDPVDRPHPTQFALWLRQNYSPTWSLADLVARGIGVHNGRMHRCLSQIQIRLFEHSKGFETIVSTSSIIEGVNTSAQNVIVWKSKLGRSNLKDFTYKNIIGRGGRMFKYFVGRIYLLDAPPQDEQTQLDIEFPDQILGDLDEAEDKGQLTDAQVDRILEYKRQMSELVGEVQFARMRAGSLLQDSDSQFLLDLARDMRKRPADWSGLGYLNSSDPSRWHRMLFKVVGLKRSAWDTQWTKVVEVTKALASNWDVELPTLINRLERQGIGIEEFFQIERSITFKLAALLNDVNELHKAIINPSVDISGFVARVSRAFLPAAVFQLEEYGLPRMIAKKIHRAGLIDFTDPQLDLRAAIERLQELGSDAVQRVQTLTKFDRYVVRFFFDGVTADSDETQPASIGVS